jgi:hypothetical protein
MSVGEVGRGIAVRNAAGDRTGVGWSLFPGLRNLYLRGTP